jgi:hypothetical protein
VSFKVCAERCDQCLFSKTPIVSDTRRKQVLRDCARRDTHFICHKHGHGAGGELAGEDVCCRGFYDANPMRRLAVCEHCDATMVDDDACEHIERGADTLGSFAEPCCGDDPVQKAIHRIIWTARTLKPGTGFVCLAPCGMIVARSSTGLLRTGHYEAGMARWWRADVEQCIRESAEVLLDWRKCGYAAGDRRRSLDRDLGEIYRVEGIGREIVRLHA